MSTQSSVAQSSESNILEKPSPTHAVDPIFQPRRCLYDLEELKYIASLAPLDALPPTLRRSRTNRSPPKIHFGWIIEGESKDYLMDKARGIQRYVHEYDESLWDEEDRIELPQCLDDLDDLEYAAADLLKGLNIKLPCSQYVEVVSTVAARCTPCFALFSNYDLEKNMPSEEEIKAVQEGLKLKGKPAWWPSLIFSWRPSY